MDKPSLLQSFAVDKDGAMQSVDDVARGLACDCTCPSCGERVLARQGEIREWHFAHASGADCEGSAESALHRAAKQVLVEAGGMMVPEQRVLERVTLPDGRTATGEARRPETWVDFTSVEAEKPFGPIRPDVAAVLLDGRMTFIEVAVCHFIDTAKRDILVGLGVPVIEIDLGTSDRVRWTWDELRAAVVDGVQQKLWVQMVDRQALEDEARESAMRAAWGAGDVTPASRARPPRRRYRVEGRFVDLIDLPFGIAIWSPYDPVLNERLKSLAYRLGGRWQSRFKNWLIPAEGKPFVEAELEKWADGPAEVR